MMLPARSPTSAFGDEAVTVGNDGRILVREGTDWHVSGAPTTKTLTAVHAYATGHAFIVGYSGTVLY